MAEFTGRYITAFDICDKYIYRHHNYYYKDYGGLVKIPFGNDFSINHVLFSCLCAINFVLNGIEGIISEEVSTKLRMEYICYYYIQNILGQIRDEYDIDLSMSNQFSSKEFRNSMTHYKLGVALKKSDLILSDPLKGLTQKFFRASYDSIKSSVINELVDTAEKIEVYLGLKRNRVLYLQHGKSKDNRLGHILDNLGLSDNIYMLSVLESKPPG